MSKFIGFFGNNKEYTTTWEAVDKDYKSDGDIGGQLKRVDFFKEQLPTEIRTELDLLERAKKVYYFIQGHYNWNEKYSDQSPGAPPRNCPVLERASGQKTAGLRRV